MTKNSQLIKKLVGLATLTALVFVLQFWSASIKFGSVSITLALVPIAMGAILYGPLAGLFLGAFMGVIVIADPATQSVFMSVNPAATIFLCLLKTGLAGLIAGFIFKLFAHFAKKTASLKKKNINALVSKLADLVSCCLLMLDDIVKMTILGGIT